MTTKTLYVRPSDEDMWLRAETFAARTRRSLSQLVITALDWYISEYEDEVRRLEAARDFQLQSSGGPGPYRE